MYLFNGQTYAEESFLPVSVLFFIHIESERNISFNFTAGEIMPLCTIVQLYSIYMLYMCGLWIWIGYKRAYIPHFTTSVRSSLLSRTIFHLDFAWFKPNAHQLRLANIYLFSQTNKRQQTNRWNNSFQFMNWIFHELCIRTSDIGEPNVWIVCLSIHQVQIAVQRRLASDQLFV